MIIEISKDIDRYKEKVALGMSAKQLLFSAISIGTGAGIVLVLYHYIGLTGSVYVAIPIVAPTALQGFYSFNGMSFMEVMKRKIQMMFANKPLTYKSTECEGFILKCKMEEVGKKKSNSFKKQEKNQLE